MGKSSKYFHSEKSAKSYSKRVQGIVSHSPEKDRYRVSYESIGQSKRPVHDNREHQDYEDDFDFDGYTHTSEDL